jgi:membrane-associated phospholipid phosphatase
MESGAHARLAWVGRLDSRAGSLLYGWNNGRLAGAAILVSALGSQRIFIPCGILVALITLVKREFPEALVMAAVLIMTRICFTLCKRIELRSRPPVSGLSSNSFPSGHTMAAIAVYGTAAAVMVHAKLSWLPAIVVASTLLGAAVGIARVIRGFHWLTDVAAGIAVGLMLFGLGYLGLRYL